MDRQITHPPVLMSVAMMVFQSTWLMVLHLVARDETSFGYFDALPYHAFIIKAHEPRKVQPLPVRRALWGGP